MRRSGFWKYGLHGLVLAGLVVAATKYLDGGAILQALEEFDWRYLGPILALSVAYVLVKGWRFVRQLRNHGVPDRVLMQGYVAGQACTVLPGGAAVRAALLKQVRIPGAESAASIALSSLSDQAVLMGGSLLAALWFEAARPPALALLTALAVISVVLGIEASRTWLLGVIERFMGRIRKLDFWRRFLDSLSRLWNGPVLASAVGNAALAFALMVLALDLSLRGVGGHVPMPTLLLAFTLPALLGRISAMPGGLGVTEAGMIGILDAAPGITQHQAVCATLVFRAGTLFFAALVGGIVYLVAWRRHAAAGAAAARRAPAS